MEGEAQTRSRSYFGRHWRGQLGIVRLTGAAERNLEVENSRSCSGRGIPSLHGGGPEGLHFILVHVRGFRPRHLGPSSTPTTAIWASRSLSCASFALRLDLAVRVSCPCVKIAALQKAALNPD